MIFPTPFLARADILRAPPKHLVLAFDGAGKLMLLGSADRKRFFPMPVKGDAGTGFTSFYRHAVRNGKLYVGGNRGSTPFLLKCNLSLDPTKFDVVNTGLPAGGQLGGVAANADYVVAVETGGNVSVSTDGDTFAAYSSLAGGQPRSIAANASGFIVGQVNATVRLATDPRGAWSSRSTGWGGTAPQNNASNVIAGSVNYAAVGARSQIATTPVSNPASFTQRSTPSDAVGQSVDTSVSNGAATMLVFGPVQTNSLPAFIRSNNQGADWTSPAAGQRPWDNGAVARVDRSAFIDGEFFAWMDAGRRISASPDGLDWDELPNNLMSFAGSGFYHIPLAA